MLRRLGIEREELGIFGWSTATLFLLGWADVSLKNVAEVVFVKRVGVEYLPSAFLASSLMLVASTYAIAVLAARGDRVRLLTRTLVGLGVALLPIWALLLADTWGAPAVPILVSKQVESIALLVFLQALGDLLHPRQAKRLLAPLMAGMTLGFMLGSFASGPLGERIGVEGMLPFSSAVLWLAAATTWPLRRAGRAGLRRRETSATEAMAPVPVLAPSETTGIRRLWRESVLFRLLALLTLGNALLSPMLYWDFQYVADLTTRGQNGEVRLLEIYAWFRGWVSVGILAIQLGVASNLYRRIGLPLAAAISPAIYLLGFAGLSVQLSLTAGVAALAGTKLVDNAVFDPALRVLYNLFREGVRARASALLEGPVKRGGGALGNVVTQAAIGLGSPGWLGWLGIPLALGWLGVSMLLWRLYPALLVRAASARGTRGFDPLPVSELLDRSTERTLAQRLVSDDPDTVRVAMDLCAEADPRRAVASFARAARDAPPDTRPLLVDGLDRLLEARVGQPLVHGEAARDLRALLEDGEAVSGLTRANVVQAFGRLSAEDTDPADRELLEGLLREGDPAVRLAARAALTRRGLAGEEELTEALAETLRGDHLGARRIACEELRAELLLGDPDRDPGFPARLELLAGLLDESRPTPERAAAADALADVTRRHGERAAHAAERLVAYWDDLDAAVRAAAVRAAGFAGLRHRIRSIVSRVTDEDEPVARAARDAILALGAAAADVLLVELSYGRRSQREAILRLVAEIEVGKRALATLYERELEDARRALLHRAALHRSRASPLLLQRLEERLDEHVHAMLHVLASLHREPALADVGQHVRRTRDARRRAILLEALEALLDPGEKDELVPLLDDAPLGVRAAACARDLGVPVPPPDLALRSLRDDRDELTRLLAEATTDESGVPLARFHEVRDPDRMLEPVEIALYLRKTHIFESLATRHLLEIAGVVKEERHRRGAELFHEGDTGTSMYLIVDGEVRITRGTRVVSDLGPEQFFGEVGLLEGVERSATATTLSDTRLLRLEREDLLTLMDELPAIAIGVAQELSRRLRQNLERLGG